jgi:HAE1 family hydrophobic/amphiphilic exporter-1
MTAFAFILGCVPLWTASGAGGVSRQVLGSAVIGGMMAASVLAIFFIPVSFDVVERFGIWAKGERKETGKAAAAGEALRGAADD